MQVVWNGTMEREQVERQRRAAQQAQQKELERQAALKGALVRLPHGHLKQVVVSYLERHPTEWVNSHQVMKATGIPVVQVKTTLRNLRVSGVIDRKGKPGTLGGYRLCDGYQSRIKR